MLAYKPTVVSFVNTNRFHSEMANVDMPRIACTKYGLNYIILIVGFINGDNSAEQML